MSLFCRFPNLLTINYIKCPSCILWMVTFSRKIGGTILKNKYRMQSYNIHPIKLSLFPNFWSAHLPVPFSLNSTCYAYSFFCQTSIFFIFDFVVDPYRLSIMPKLMCDKIWALLNSFQWCNTKSWFLKVCLIRPSQHKIYQFWNRGCFFPPPEKFVFCK